MLCIITRNLAASLDVPQVITVPVSEISILAAFLVYGLEFLQAPILAFAFMKKRTDFLVGSTICRGIRHDQSQSVEETLLF